MTNKKFEELSADEMKDLKIEFAPGCFDNFDGTQEELDGLIAEITEMFRTGKAQELARPLDFDNLDETDIELIEHMVESEENSRNRKLQ